MDVVLLLVLFLLLLLQSNSTSQRMHELWEQVCMSRLS